MSMQFFRKKKNSVFTMIIFGIIILTFILWGAFSPGNLSPTTLTIVNGDEIPYSEFQRALQMRLQMYGQMLGGQPPNEHMSQLIERQVAAGLVFRKLQAQEAERLHLYVSDKEILENLEKNQAFQDPELKRFSPKIYQLVLQANGFTPTDYESMLREELLADRLREFVDQTVLVSAEEVKDAYVLQNTSMNLEVATFQPSQLLNQKKVRIPEEKIADYYEQRKGEFLSNEKRVLEIASLKPSDFKETEITQEEIEAAFHANPSDPRWSEQRAHAFHILISDLSEAGLKKIQGIKNQLAKSKLTEASFREMARKTSEDYGSAPQGGDLAYFNESTMVKPFTDAVFKKASLRSVYGPFKSDHGYHLVYVADRTTKEATLENRRQEIHYDLKKSNLLKAQQEMAERARAEVAKAYDAETFKGWLTNQGFQIQATAAIDMNSRVEGLPMSVFHKALRIPEKGKWQGPEEIQSGIYLYRVTDILPSQPLSLADARPLILKRMESEVVEKYVKDIFNDIKTGKLPWTNLKSAGAKVTTHKDWKPFISTEVPGFPESELLLRAAQNLREANAIEGPYFSDGEWIIVRGTNFRSPSDSKISKEEFKKLEEARLAKGRAQVFERLNERLLKEAKIPEDFKRKYLL